MTLISFIGINKRVPGFKKSPGARNPPAIFLKNVLPRSLQISFRISADPTLPMEPLIVGMGKAVKLGKNATSTQGNESDRKIWHGLDLPISLGVRIQAYLLPA